MNNCNVTYFRNFKEVSKPKYSTIADALDRIKSGKIKDKIETLRSLSDPAEAKRYKSSELPCILFSGEFKQRNDSGIVCHSGLAIIDFDNVDPIEYKYKLKSYQWIYAIFTSPSGNGVKALAKIPAEPENHRGYYNGIIKELKWLKGLDTTSINPSRICFESYDPELYVNPNAVEFTRFVEDAPVVTTTETRTALVTDYGKLNQAVKKILNAPDGEKHAELLKASRLAGGWIAGGLVDEIQAILALEEAIQSRKIDDFQGAQKTIRDGIAYGKTAPLISETVNLNDDDFGFISTAEDEFDYMEKVRTNTLPQGLSTGYPEFDKYYRFKHGNFVIINGHDNVGKSSFLWYMAVISNVLHGWKWIMYCAENPEAQVRKSLMQYKCGKEISKMNPVEYQSALKWAYDNFTIIRSEEMVSAGSLLTMAQKINNRSHHDALLIDPYNALDLELENTKLSSHEYHYKVTALMRAFCKRNKTAMYVNCHAVTEALRRIHKDGDYAGYLMAPNKADTEGGGKFSNRADDFLTIHRHTNHPTDFNITEVHVRKIKETETGGRPTLKDDPIRFKMTYDAYGFYDPTTGFNPLSDTAMKIEREERKQQRLVERDYSTIKVRDLGDAPF